jgi:hypothetical protein
MAPGTARLQLVAPLGADAFGTFWHAYDLARGVPVQVHELQGFYAQWRPATLPGYELVEEGGRAFVILPTAPPPVTMTAPPPAPAAPTPARRSGRRWLVIGLIAFVVVAVIAATVVFALRPSSSPATPAVPPGGYQPVNSTLIGVAIGDCRRLPTKAWTDPTTELNATVAPCQAAPGVYTVSGYHESIPRERVQDSVKLCGTADDGRRIAAWASRNGLFGTLVCFRPVEG